jgi:hypothetical protein
MTRHRAFADAVSRGRAAQNLWWELKMKNARKGAEAMTSMFALKNINPTEWRDVKYQQHQHTHQIKQLTDEELNRIAAGEPGDGDGAIEGTFERLDPQQANER